VFFLQPVSGADASKNDNKIRSEHKNKGVENIEWANKNRSLFRPVI
jgi:hypothetical protein